jgi:cell division septation protein DedD
MKYTKTLLSTAAVALLATGCVKPTKEDKNPVVYDNSQPVYEEPAPIVYESAGTSQSGVIYTDAPVDNTVITTNGTYTQPASGTYTTQPASTAGTQVYTNPYETAPATNYPDPYANAGAATSYPAPVNNYPVSSTPAPAGGIHLQIAALKDYYAATEFKNTLTLAPGQSAYVKRGAMNKVIVTGISSMQEANQLKETRFPGSFIVQGSGGGYTPPVTPAYNTGSYTVNNSYGSASSHAASGNGIGVQIGAFSRRAQAQDVADSQRGQYSPIIKKIGKYYKVILTGFSSRAAAKSALSSGKIPNGFVVSY